MVGCEGGDEKVVEKNDKGEVIYEIDLSGALNPEAITKAVLTISQSFRILSRYEKGRVMVDLDLNPKVKVEGKELIGEIRIQSVPKGIKKLSNSEIVIGVTSSMEEMNRLGHKTLISALNLEQITGRSMESFSNLSEAIGMESDWLTNILSQILANKAMIKAIQEKFGPKIRKTE